MSFTSEESLRIARGQEKIMTLTFQKKTEKFGITLTTEKYNLSQQSGLCL